MPIHVSKFINGAATPTDAAGISSHPQGRIKVVPTSSTPRSCYNVAAIFTDSVSSVWSGQWLVRGHKDWPFGPDLQRAAVSRSATVEDYNGALVIRTIGGGVDEGIAMDSDLVPNSGASTPSCSGSTWRHSPTRHWVHAATVLGSCHRQLWTPTAFSHVTLRPYAIDCVEAFNLFNNVNWRTRTPVGERQRGRITTRRRSAHHAVAIRSRLAGPRSVRGPCGLHTITTC